MCCGIMAGRSGRVLAVRNALRRCVIFFVFSYFQNFKFQVQSLEHFVVFSFSDAPTLPLYFHLQMPPLYLHFHILLVTNPFVIALTDSSEYVDEVRNKLLKFGVKLIQRRT